VKAFALVLLVLLAGCSPTGDTLYSVGDRVCVKGTPVAGYVKRIVNPYLDPFGKQKYVLVFKTGRTLYVAHSGLETCNDYLAEQEEG